VIILDLSRDLSHHRVLRCRLMLIFNSSLCFGFRLYFRSLLSVVKPFLNTFSLSTSSIQLLQNWLLRSAFLYCRIIVPSIADSDSRVGSAGATTASPSDARISRSTSSAFVVRILR
jgi:hypothetical protein